MHIHRANISSNSWVKSACCACWGTISGSHKSPIFNDKSFFNLISMSSTSSCWQKLFLTCTIVLDDTIHRQTVKQSLRWVSTQSLTLETIRAYLTACYFSLSPSHTHSQMQAHTPEHKYWPTLFGLSSWSTTQQISDELLQLPFSVTFYNPNFI